MNQSARRFIQKALTGLAAAGLLITIALLAAAPTNRFDFPKLGCGASAIWHVNGRPGTPGVIERVAPLPWPGLQTTSWSTAQSCKEIVEARLRLAGATSAVTVALFTASFIVSRRPRTRTPSRYHLVGVV